MEGRIFKACRDTTDERGMVSKKGEREMKIFCVNIQHVNVLCE